MMYTYAELTPVGRDSPSTYPKEGVSDELDKGRLTVKRTVENIA